MRRLIPLVLASFLFVSCGNSDSPSTVTVTASPTTTVTVTASPSEAAYVPDMAYIENEIGIQWAEAAHYQEVLVSCPDSIEWRVGEVFHCSGRVAGMGGGYGDPRPATVYMENEEGAYTWQEGQ